MRQIHARKWVAVLIVGGVLGFGLPLLTSLIPGFTSLGVAMAQESASDNPTTPGRPETFGDYWKQGGSTMWPMLGLAIWGTAVFIELMMKLRPPYFCPAHIVAQVTGAMEVSDYQKAWRIAMENPAPIARIFAAAVEKIPRGREAVEITAAEAAMEENNTFKTKNSYLSLVAAVGPMLGLFGTMSGMISAFNKMAYEGGTGDPSKLAGSIGEALITTYAGLVVAIPAMTIYYVIGNRIKAMMALTQNTLTQLIEYVDFDKLPDDLVVVTREMKMKMLSGEFSSKKGKGGAAKSPATTAPAKSSKSASAPVAAPVAPASAAQMVPCPNCSKELAVGTKKCASCGTDLDWE